MNARNKSLTGAAIAILMIPAANGATFLPEYNDSSGEGFFSTDPPDSLSQDDGNPGDTLGAQRRWAFEKALEFWGLRLESSVTIRVAAEMNSLECSSSGAVLGNAGPGAFFAFNTGFSPHPIKDTWYPSALVDRFTGSDEDPENSDISSEFNADIDSGCFSGGTWYYALGDAPSGRVSFFETVVHELAHGVGFLTIVDLENGKKAADSEGNRLDDIYMVFLEDHSESETKWPDLTDAGRKNSATDTNDLHWVGSDVTGSLGDVNNGTSDGHTEMYAPSDLKLGSSVSHWDEDVIDSNSQQDVMTPAKSNNQKLLLTEDLLHDIGWNDAPAKNCVLLNDRVTESSILTGNNSHDACVSVTYDGASVDSGETNAFAGQQIIMKNGFRVQEGAIFSVQTDTSIGL